jgi:hypothetical protein
MKGLGSASRHQIFFVAVLLAYLILAIGTASTRQPYGDEGWLASPAHTLVHRGYMAVIPSDRHRDSHKAYWMPPVFFLVQAAWQSFVGFGVVQFRLGSVVAGLVLLLAIHYVVSKLSNDRTLALIIMSLVALDYTFVQHAGIGRPEMMSSAFAVCSLAAHLALRQPSLGLALLASHALMATSALTHPVGAFLWIPALLGLQAYLDLKALRSTSLLLIALPYLVGGAAWGLYILDNPKEFRSQFSGIALGSNRFAGLQDPFHAVQREVYRFLGYYGVRPNASLLVKLKLVLPVGYAMGILAALLVPAARRSRFIRTALLLCLVQFLTLAVFEGTKQYHYILHIIPAFLTVLGGVLWLGWQHAWIPRVMLSAIAFILILAQISPTVFRFTENRYYHDFLPVLAYIRPYVEQGDLILGEAEFAIPLGFPDNLVADERYGFKRSLRPRLVVADVTVYEGNKNSVKKRGPQLYEYLNEAFPAEFEAVFQRGNYTVYRRRE